ncbi:MAG: Nif3-like dinuclear metal center hexameric protein [Clostridia bacterium]|nr:Nif3-like dinuclear metal center hexameric protein [Clostridia bacterium]MBP3495318.1 Nif3-like dinuclear metal center hexameric protein [Clostridia bacterium]MBQ7788231.1 Nif3-like dinuclear metal center hexameric protein [Clostridia bacterium]
MTFYELYKNLSKLYPDTLRCEWDNDGIMCADDVNGEVGKVLISLDITSSVVDYAIDNGFDTIVSHHPLVFHSQKALTPLNYTQNKLIKLVKNGVRAMSFHTRLDATDGGVNDTLVSILELKNVIKDEIEPIGRIANTIEPMELSAFAKQVKEKLSAPAVLYSGNKKVNKVYIVGGDGKDLIERALEMGADTLLTGRGSYNTSIDAEDMGLNIVEAGHFYTEHPVCKTIEKDILKIEPKIKTEIYFSNKINLI